MDLSIVVMRRFSFPSIGMATAKNCLETWASQYSHGILQSKDCIAMQFTKHLTSRACVGFHV